MRNVFSMLVLAGLALVLGACSSDPYVHRGGEYNRNSQDFGQPISDIYNVTICYSSYSATPQQVSKLAAEECAAFNKTATFTKQNYSTCPLTAPVAAVYSCKSGPAGAGGGSASGDQGIPGQTIMNYDGIQFRY